MNKVITLLTDFGLRDPYVASMKGVILSINPSAVIVDLSHEVARHDVKAAALLLWASYRFFPEGTIHVVVVDPGVGTARRPLAIKTKRYFFVGPDNGVLMMAALDDGLMEVREITNPSFMLSVVSPTFHGRDVFAPTAAKISLHHNAFKEVGPCVKDPVSLSPPTYSIKDHVAIGEVIHIDIFGNIVTSIPSRVVEELVGYGGKCEIKVGIKRIETKLVKAYAEVKEGETLLVPDSFGLAEIAINKGDAASFYNVKVGDRVEIKSLA